MTDMNRHSPSPRRVTIRDVARASNTSISTVSVALAGRSGVSDETRARVLEVANRLGWRPDRRASNLRRQDIRLVGVVYEAESVFQARLLDALYVAAEESNVQLVLAAATAHHDERKCVNVLLQERCQSLVLTGSGLSSGEIRTIGRRLPTLSLCRYVHEEGVDAVVTDDDMGYGLLIDHLVALGHRDIVHADGGPANLLSGRRVAAYEKAMRAHGLERWIRVISGGTTIAEGVRAVQGVMALEPAPTAVTCYNDASAAAVVRTLRKARIAVPEAMSITGYDDGPDAADPSTGLTTVQQEPTDLARVTMEVLRRRVDAGVVTQPGEEELVVLPTSLIIRESTGPVRSGTPVTAVSA